MKNQPVFDPFESAEYQKFVESMVPHCHCSPAHRPCDGVLAGGVCDGIKDDRDEYPYAVEDSEDEDAEEDFRNV